MRELKLSQCFSMIVLNAQDSINMTTVKKLSLRCIAAAVVLETYLEGEFINSNDKLCLKRKSLSKPEVTLYQEAVLKPLFNKNEKLEEDLNWWLTKASNLSSKNLKALEKRIIDSLKGDYHIEEIPSLLGCDLFYKTSGLSLKEYRSNSKDYSRIVEGIKAEVLEDGEISDESAIFLWLLRESGSMNDIFSKGDMELVYNKMNGLFMRNEFLKKLYNIHIHHGVELAVKGFLNMKRSAVKTPVGTGVNFVFPMIDRSQSIFIDAEEWLPNSKDRLEDVKKRLDESGHSYIIVRSGDVPIIKIDNVLYEAIPEAIGGRIPIHGVRLRRYSI
ncbi:MAG: hypothetical protein HUJ77_08040 [Clostridium sp.]|uniref:hypothetical protein n=1 Tax=Clostridium sp. TaxID=1506 RepID=UPI0025BB0254|nr:hypothetical protein [Clostridium sp.]MCF0148335.1 hypothetical protein [Clostridium sp.]